MEVEVTEVQRDVEYYGVGGYRMSSRTDACLLSRLPKTRQCRRSTGWLRRPFQATLRGQRYKSVGLLVGNLDVCLELLYRLRRVR